MWIHKSLSETTEHYKYWSDRIIETRCKINRGYVTVLGKYTSEEGRHTLNNDFCEQQQNIYVKVNKNDYLLKLRKYEKRMALKQ